VILDNNNTDRKLYFIVDFIRYQTKWLSFMFLMKYFFSLEQAVIIGNAVLFIALLMVGTAYYIIQSRYSLVYYRPSRIVVHV